MKTYSESRILHNYLKGNAGNVKLGFSSEQLFESKSFEVSLNIVGVKKYT